MRSLALAALAALAALTLNGAARAEAKPLAWDDVFSLRDAPKGVHLKASYLDAKGASHDLEVWRDGDARLRRRTDDKIDLFAEKTGTGEYAFHLVDLDKKRLIEVSRTNLYRIGVFTDWSALAGMLTRPKGAHTLRPDVRPRQKTRAGECRWIRLEVQAGGAKEICWSDRFKVPLIIQTPAPNTGFTTVFEVKQIEAKVPGAEVFKIARQGLTVIAADQDINPASD